MSDEDLAAAISGQSVGDSGSSDLSAMSDEDLASRLGTVMDDTGRSSIAPPEDTAIPFGDTSDLEMDSGDNPNEVQTPAPLNPIQSLNMGAIRTPEYKAKYAKALFPTSDVQVMPDGNIRIDQDYLDPKNTDGIIHWLIDKGNATLRFAGANAAPIAGALAADASVVAAAAPTAGASLPGIMMANAAGTAAGVGARQAYANQLIGEPFSGSNMAIEGAAGGAGAGVAKALEPVAKWALKPLAKTLSKIGDKAMDMAAPLFDSLQLSKSPKSTQYLMNQKRLGRNFDDIINPRNMPGSRMDEIFNNTFLGSPTAKVTRDGIARQYTKHLLAAGDDSASKDILRAFYRDLTGIPDDVLVLTERLVDEHGAGALSRIMDPRKVAQDSWNKFGDDAIRNVTSMYKKMKTSWATGEAKAIGHTRNARSTVGLKDVMEQLHKDLAEMTIMTPDVKFSSLYGDKQVVKFYKELTSLMLRHSAKDNGTLGFSKAIKLPNAYAMMRSLESTVDQAFKKFTPAEVRPLQVMLDTLRTRITSADKTGIMRKNDVMMKKLHSSISILRGAKMQKETGSEYFASVVDGNNLSHNIEGMDRLNFINSVKNAHASGDKTLLTELEKFDLLMPANQKLAPQLAELHAAEAWQQTLVPKAMHKSFVSQSRSIHTATAESDMTRQALAMADNAIPSKSHRFLTDVEDHLTADAFGSSKTNIFRARIVAGMIGVGTGAGFTFTGHPLVGAAVMGGSIYGMTPRGFGQLLKQGEKMAGVPGKAISGAYSAAQGLSGSTAGRVGAGTAARSLTDWSRNRPKDEESF